MHTTAIKILEKRIKELEIIINWNEEKENFNVADDLRSEIDNIRRSIVCLAKSK